MELMELCGKVSVKVGFIIQEREGFVKNF